MQNRRNPGEAEHTSMWSLSVCIESTSPVFVIKAGEDDIRFPSTTFRASNPTLESAKNNFNDFMLEREPWDERTVLMTARVVYSSRTIIDF